MDDQVYATVPDSQIALTERGFAQAVVAGLQIRSLVGNGTVRCVHSPSTPTLTPTPTLTLPYSTRRLPQP